MKLIGAVLALTLLAGCAAPTPFETFFEAYPEIGERTRFEYDFITRLSPPEGYEELYTEISECLTRADFPVNGRQFDSIRFWVTSDLWELRRDLGLGRLINGVWLVTGDLVLDESRLETTTVNHEMVHALMPVAVGHSWKFLIALSLCGR